MNTEEITEYLNKKSGLIGLSGYSSNLGEIIEAAEQGNKDCELAFKVYVNRLRSFIGSFLFQLNGADALVFTDDAGVKYAKMREAVCRNTDAFGLVLDEAKNREYVPGNETCISRPESHTGIWVIPTDEERTIFEEVKCIM